MQIRSEVSLIITVKRDITLSDLALINGTVLTMNQFQPQAEAIAIKNGRIVNVCTNEEIRRWIGKNTKVINLDGKTVVPGFIDTHIHVADFAKFLTWLNLKDAKSIEELKNNLRKHARKTRKGKWIIGHGWDQARFVEKRFPSLLDLNEASPDKPVILYHQCGKLCVVNSKALELAGVTRQTIAPEGGTIVKDEVTGELTGILQDDATNLVWSLIPAIGEEELTEAIGLACEKIVQAGVTSVHWMVSSPIEISIIKKLLAENRVPLRICMVIPAELLDDVTSSVLRKGSEDNLVRIGGVEIFVDGFLASRTAALLQPYSDDPSTKGKLMCSQHEVDALTARVRKANLQLIIHAMGDQAIDLALNAFEKVSGKASPRNHRHRLEQAAVINEGLIQRMKKLEVIVSVQPHVIVSEFAVWSAAEHLGPSRVRWLYPLRTLLREGIRVSGGSDCPMEPLNPLSGIQAAVTRNFFTEERITVDEALRIYTVNAAYSSCEENIKGSIEKGKLADITVISRDPLTVQPNEIEAIDVELTIVGGRVVYSKSFS